MQGIRGISGERRRIRADKSRAGRNQKAPAHSRRGKRDSTNHNVVNVVGRVVENRRRAVTARIERVGANTLRKRRPAPVSRQPFCPPTNRHQKIRIRRGDKTKVAPADQPCMTTMMTVTIAAARKPREIQMHCKPRFCWRMLPKSKLKPAPNPMQATQRTDVAVQRTGVRFGGMCISGRVSVTGRIT